MYICAYIYIAQCVFIRVCKRAEITREFVWYQIQCIYINIEHVMIFDEKNTWR